MNKETNKTTYQAAGKSDETIVPEKQPNKVSLDTAEPVEGSGPAKGNAREDAPCRTQSRKPASIGLAGVREVARRDKEVRFTALLHHVNVDRLRASYFQMRKAASPGIDGMTWAEYGEE